MKNLLPFLIFFGIIIGCATSTNSQVLTTKLQITVRNDAGNLEKDVKVSLYRTKEDYEASKNAVEEILTVE
jgi:hypothetical protein